MALVTTTGSRNQPAPSAPQPAKTHRRALPLRTTLLPAAVVTLFTTGVTALYLLGLVALLTGCEPPQEPDSFRTAEVTIDEVTPTISPEGASVVVIYGIENRDKEPINLAALSFQIETTVRRHVHMVRQETPIPPGDTCWFETRLPLEQEEPTIGEDDVSLLSATFQ